jgi:superfamily I DNA/RNA helicase
MSNPDTDRYGKASRDRQERINAILRSPGEKKIVVAGPGTGKTFIFKEILAGKTNTLILTFVNSLVEDLSLELCAMSEVKTLHGFARSVMARAVGSVRVFPKLSWVITEDAEVLRKSKIDFDALFHNRDDQNEHIAFYKRRKSYYGHYGFTDLIYAAVLYLEQNKDRIPSFDQIVVDEFQDFNLLEVSLIDLLASRSPILIAGDDDQSLYFFKSADPTHIRKRYGIDDNLCESFNLPHCSRCTRVIVDSVNDIVRAAVAEGHLKGRIAKPYIYFEAEEKEQDCRRYPKLTHVACFAKQIPFYISTAIREIAENRREKFSVLVIAPTKARCGSVAKALRKKGFKNILYVDEETAKAPDLLNGLQLLANNSKCNLGWRIAARALLADSEFKTLLQNTDGDGAKSIYELIGDDFGNLVSL